MTSLPAAAQEGGRIRAQLPPGAVVQSLDEGPSAQLRRSLTALGENPRSLSALINAGRAALELGDPQAALTFFSRAEEVAPTDPRVKAGMGSAMVQVGEPRAGLTLFAEALAQGAPEIEIAADRGLAHDLTGDPQRAQQDYALVLRRRDDAEVRRRMALSLAITGQRDAALRLIDPQLRRNDRAAWRTQTFVLALTGDAAAASRTARNIMPGGVGDAMAPFLSRLAQLSPAQKAMAVHLGQFPSDGRPGAMASNDLRPDPGALALAQGREPAPAAAPPRAATEERRVERRRPGAPASPLERAAVGGRQAAPSQPLRVAETVRRQPQASAPLRVAEADTGRYNPPPAPARPVERGPIVVPPATGTTVIPRFGTAPVPAATTSVPAQPPSAAATLPPAATTPPSGTQQPPSGSVETTFSTTQPLSTNAQPMTPSGDLGLSASPPAQGASPPPSPSTTGVIQTTELPPSLAQSAASLQPTATVPNMIGNDPAPGVVLPLNPVSPPAPQSAPTETNAQLAPSAAGPGPAATGPAMPAAPGFTLAPAAGQAEARVAPPTPATRPPLADIAALVRTLPRDEQARLAEAPPRPARPAPAQPRTTQGQQPAQAGRTARAETNSTAPRSARGRAPAAPAHPSRHWVQVAGGANRAALPREFARLRTLAPQLLGRRDAYTTPLRATNRLLVGPFRSEREALEFVNQLRRADVPAFAWTSEAGQEIERLQTNR